jgi:hypothetical protein
MMKFRFEVNSSFLKYFGRPITVPKSRADYRTLEVEHLASNDLVIICPNGERMTGSMITDKRNKGYFSETRVDNL